MQTQCPSCKSKTYLKIDSVSCDRLVAGYASAHLQVNILPALPPGITEIDLFQCEHCGVRWYSPMIAGGPDFYEALQQHDWYYQKEKPEYPHAAVLIPGGAKVLEVGCGRGAFAPHLRGIDSYKGLEFNREAIRKAAAAGLNVVELPIEDEAAQRPGQYDVVCHFQVLEHVPDSLGFMTACVAALRPGGMLIVTVPSEDSFLSVSTAAWLNMPPHHVTRWTDKALTNLFTRLGLSVQPVWHEPIADFHSGWYRSTMHYLGLCKILGHRVELDDRSFVPRVARRMARVKVLDEWLYKTGEQGFSFRSRGHSVCFSGVKAE